MIHQTTLQLFIAGIRWRSSRNAFNASVKAAHYDRLTKQETSRRAFLSQVYIASKCETANSPAANLVMKSVAELTVKLKTLTPDTRVWTENGIAISLDDTESWLLQEGYKP